MIYTSTTKRFVETSQMTMVIRKNNSMLWKKRLNVFLSNY